jgi:hypothetical protein
LTTYDRDTGAAETWRPLSEWEWENVADGTVRGSSIAHGGAGMRQNYDLACAGE